MSIDRPHATATLLIAALVAVLAASVANLAVGVPNLFLEDDAYFYLQIAWNISQNHGSTFDGLNITNGYHLLWMGVLVPLASMVHLVGLGKPAFVFITCVVAIGIAVTSVVSTFGTWPERALAILLFVLSGITMETTLLTCLILLLVRQCLDEVAANAPRLFALGALVPLARIDFFWLPMVLAWALSAFSPTNAKVFRFVAAGTLTGVLAHFALERALFHEWTSVSSAYKADSAMRAGLDMVQKNLASSGNLLRFSALTCLGSLAIWGVLRARPVRWGTLVAIFAAILPVIAYSILTPLRDWYFAVSLLISMFLASRQWTSTDRIWRWSVWSLASTLLVTSAGYLFIYRVDRQKTAGFIKTANESLSADHVAFLVDGSGFVGYWLNARVVNGDGLVNSWPYRRRLTEDGLANYLTEIKATHIITNSPKILSPILSWHGLVVPSTSVSMVLDTGPTRNRFERYRLFALRQPSR